MSKVHITKEVVKAETRLLGIRRSTEKAIDRVTLKWMTREAEYVESLSEDVKRGLRACGVIGTDAPVFIPESLEPEMDLLS